jgi:hypothetical protein
MPNTTGSYQPFGTGWNNLSNYLTKSNLGATKTDGMYGAANMQNYKNPDAGSSFDEWLMGVTKNTPTDISQAPAPGPNPVRAPRPPPPQQQAAPRRPGALRNAVEDIVNPYSNPRNRYNVR